MVKSMGVPYAKHRGGVEDAVGVRVDSNTSKGVSSLPFMAVKYAASLLPQDAPGTGPASLCMHWAGL